MSTRIKAYEVRNPLTIEEADGAIVLAESAIETIEDQIEERGESDPGWYERASKSLLSWSELLVCLRYWRVRLGAGDLPLSIELAHMRAANAALLARAVAAEKAPPRVVREDTSSLRTRCLRLQEHNRALEEALKKPAKERAEYLRHQWEIYLIFEANPESFWATAASSVPKKFRAAWNAERIERGRAPARSPEEITPPTSALALLAAEIEMGQ